MIGQGFCREMWRGEESAVEALLRIAFETDAEARLVTKLRQQGAMAGEMVVPRDDEIIGYYALSWFQKPKGWLCLAPVVVHPDLRGQGVGRRMIAQLAEWARLSGQCIVAQGEVAFFERAGFSMARAARLRSPHPGSQLTLAGPGKDGPDRALVYPTTYTVKI